jgi:dTDP-4-dehydrorhamnose reductase
VLKVTNVLILGKSGMLGSMVYHYFTNFTNLNIYGTVRKTEYLQGNDLLFDAFTFEQLEENDFIDLKIDYIINCIGITKPFSKDNDPEGVKRAIAINSKFPWQLAEYASKHDIKVIQIGTDCVYSGKGGLYNEDSPHDPLDVYGKSKSLGEVFDGTALIIRCSIIGPEAKDQKSFLLEWFFSQPQGGTIGGYEHHLWNGVTTLQFAQLCEKIIVSNGYDELLEKSYVHHFTPNTIVNKYELMNIFNETFKKELVINQINKPDEKVDRTLASKYNILEKFYEKKEMKIAIGELKEYNDNRRKK